MRNKIFKEIDGIVYDMTNNLGGYVIRKAGTWQATELFADESMRVLRNVILDIECPPSIEIAKAITMADQPWSEEHFQERISGIPYNPGVSYKIWPYNKFDQVNDPYLRGMIFSHTYMERFWPKATHGVGIRYELGDLNDLINHLNDNPLTRQAYLPIFFPEDTGAAHKQRIPCSLGYLFENWGGVLDCTYNIRSCDLFRHFRNDVYLAMRLMQYVAHRTNTKVGTLTMIINNMHLFENDLYAFNKKELKILNSK